MPTQLSADSVVGAPKVLLHDHLDGGLRPQTIIELAQKVGYGALPATDADKLGQWFRDSADSGSLERYIETFDHTIAVMQTVEGLQRVAREAAEDLADDGVVYAEIRWAPEQHVEQGLSLEQVVDCVLSGFRQGEANAAGLGTTDAQGNFAVDLSSPGVCATWAGRSNSSQTTAASGPVDCVMLVRAEQRYGNGDGIFTKSEYTRAFSAWYNLAHAPYQFYGQGRRIRVGLEVVL